VHEYEPFVDRAEPSGVVRVYEVNPGIVIGTGNGHKLEDFGGMPVKQWKPGLRFEPGRENRKFTCPAWWYQSANYKLKPEWDECNETLGGSFSNCKHFCNKAKCWARFDKGGKR
jgi:hypothetical protein